MSTYRGLGLLGIILVGCGTTETQQPISESPEVLPQEKASQILSQLQENVSQDLPQRIQDQERAVAAIEKQVLEPWRLSLLARDAAAFERVAGHH